MKKILFGFLALLVSVTLFAERITSDDAAQVANNFMNIAPAPGVKNAVPHKKMVRKATAEENLFYIYENEGGEGWVIVAADDAITPILAYSETGHFRTDNLPTNIRGWLGKYNSFIRKIEADGVVASEEVTEEWNTLRKGLRRANAAVVVGPLVKTTWDQDKPYDLLCPGTGEWGYGSSKAAVGCVATAMAQVMKYWEWPKKGTGSRTYQPKNPNTGETSTRYGHQTANFGATTYDWANMLNSYSGSYSDAQATAVATLMFHCGVATEMMYGNKDDEGSGTYTVNYGDWDWGTNQGECAQNALANYFGYKKEGLTGYMRDGFTDDYGNLYTDDYGNPIYAKWSDADWTAMIKEELDKKHPIMYGGAGTKGGHSFICDGYRSDDYFHFNWGWSGSNDGYYTLSNLAPGSGGAGGGSYNFSEEQDVIIGIEPDKSNLPKVTVTWSVDGVETTTEFTQYDALVLPDAPADCENGKVFVGWTASDEVDGDKPADLFNNATGKMVTEAVTYYAVFAVKGNGTTYSDYLLTCVTPEPVYYSIRFFDNGIQIGETQSVLKGQQAEVPVGPDAACEGYIFEGWWTSELDVNNTEAKNWVTDFKAKKDQDYHAVFSKTVSGGQGLTDNYKKISSASELETANYVVAGYYSSAYNAMKNEVVNNYYIGVKKVTPSANVITTTDAGIIWKITVSGKNLTFYNEAAGQYIYMYQSGTFYNMGLTDDKSTGTGFNYQVNNGSWDFISTTFTDRYMEYYGSKGNFSAYKQAGDPIYLYKQTGASATTYYSSFVDCTPTAVTNATIAPKVVKMIQDGQVLIMRDGVRYNILGVKQ